MESAPQSSPSLTSMVILLRAPVVPRSPLLALVLEYHRPTYALRNKKHFKIIPHSPVKAQHRIVKMKQFIWSVAALVCIGSLITITECRSLSKRDTYHIDPNMEKLADHSIYRDKRKIEVVTGVKNAVLGFVFNKINKFIDQKTAWVDQLDKTNIAKNAAHHIEPPKDPILSLSSIISGVIGEKLQAVGPLFTVVSDKLGAASSHGSKGSAGFNFGAFLGGGHK